MKSYENEVEAYKKFREDRLLPERNSIKKIIEGIELEIEDYETLKKKSSHLNETSHTTEPVKIPLDLGAGYSTDFEVFDKDFVLVAVGFGFYCQMTWKEAESFCFARIQMLENRKNRISNKLRKVEEHLSITNDIIAELSK